MAKKITKAQPQPESATPLLIRYTFWILIAAAWAMVTLSLLSYDPADWPGHAVAPYNGQPNNWIGRVGAVLAHKVYLVLGPGVWLFLAGSLAYLVATARQKPITQPILRFIGTIIMALVGSALVGLSLPAVTQRPEGSGGLIAIYINTELTQRFNTLGTMIILGLGFWIGAILAIDQIVLALPKYAVKFFRAMPKVSVPSPILVGRFPGLSGRNLGDDIDRDDENEESVATASRRKKNEVEEPIDEDAGGIGGTEPFDPDAHRRADTGDSAITAEFDDDTLPTRGHPHEDDENAVVPGAEEPAPEPEASADDDEEVAADAPGAYVAEKRDFDPDALREKIKSMPINFAPKAAAGKGKPAPAREVDLSGYRFPGTDLLIEPESNFTDEMEKLVREQAVHLEEALQQYNIQGEVVGIDSGPVITLYEVRLAPGTKVSVLSGISSDLARSLKAHNIRIVPNMAGKDTVGIEVPNQVKEKVRLKELMGANQEALAKMGLPMFLGKDASGNPLVEDLTKMPHMLIAGTTGSGKSVCMNSIIMSFLLTKRPDELRLVLVDPKMVEMSMFKDLPHLMCPVVTEMSKAAAILEWATTKMDERYELLAEAGVRDLASYNALGWEELKERFNPATEAEEIAIPKKLPYLVFIIDELADLMMTNKEVEGFIVRLAQKSRAVGMHLILATQRPQANVVTGLIKSNMPCRVSFKVASGMDSRIVLDQKGAELLLGQGDMLFLSPRSSKLTRAQGTLVDDGEIRKSVKFLKELAEQNFEPQLVQLKSAGVGDVDEEAAKDPMFDEAVRCVLQTKRGSVSLLQRRLTIGYSRASRLIEAMAAAGILGEYKGSQAREVTISLEEWDAMREQAAKDAAANGGGEEPTSNRARASVGAEEKDDWANDGDDDDDVPDEMDGEYKQ